jgi:hypothetical protein
MLTNHNHKLQYGKQLRDGKVIMTFPPKPKWERTEQDNKQNNKGADKNLAAACYKLLGVKIDTEHKTKMRDIIISSDVELIEENKKYILEYCESDIKYLKPMLDEMVKHYTRLYPASERKNLKADMLYRGEYAARTAMIEELGYPISYEATKNFANSVPTIIKEVQQEINALFPEIKPFRYVKATNSYSWRQKETRDWLTANLPQDMLDGWLKTGKKKALSLKADAFIKYFPYHHDFPKDVFCAQMVRFLKLKQQLNGFLPAKEGKKTFWSSMGSDKRMRPFLGIYGSQSGRNQPSATGFLFLKSAWMRSLCVPPKGKAICAIDFGSEEFLISGILSGDKAMIDAYHSGDPYLYFAKAAGAVPPEGKKEDYPDTRNLFKSTTLGLSYGMRAKALALKLTADTGKPTTVDEAQDLIDMFEDVFPIYAEFRNEEILDQYEEQGYLKLSDGWTMFGDNINNLSISNMPVQGAGSVVLRKSVTGTQESGLKIIQTLHDALYIEYDADDLGAIDKLYDCMFRGFKDSFAHTKYADLANIRLDIDCWSQDYVDGEILETPAGKTVKAKNIYVDPRGVKEYDNFKQYFKNNVAEIRSLL